MPMSWEGWNDMTNDEAILLLSILHERMESFMDYDFHIEEDTDEALSMAIEALERGKK
jgi:hypothetical protein